MRNHRGQNLRAVDPAKIAFARADAEQNDRIRRRTDPAVVRVGFNVRTRWKPWAMGPRSPARDLPRKKCVIRGRH